MPIFKTPRPSLHVVQNYKNICAVLALMHSAVMPLPTHKPSSRGITKLLQLNGYELKVMQKFDKSVFAEQN